MKMRKIFRGNRGLSPLVATILLVAFALVIGTVTMNWGRSYVEKIKEEPEVKGLFESAIIISIKDVDTPLKELQIEYITGQITLDQYVSKEQPLISNG
jgi:flagellin-like protein